jgi:hypothetical protein
VVGEGAYADRAPSDLASSQAIGHLSGDAQSEAPASRTEVRNTHHQHCHHAGHSVSPSATPSDSRPDHSGVGRSEDPPESRSSRRLPPPSTAAPRTIPALRARTESGRGRLEPSKTRSGQRAITIARAASALCSNCTRCYAALADAAHGMYPRNTTQNFLDRSLHSLCSCL